MRTPGRPRRREAPADRTPSPGRLFPRLKGGPTSSSVRNHVARPGLSWPPKYDGQGTAFIDHLDEFTRVATFNKWTDEERCFHLWTSVTGQAKLKMRPLTYRDYWREMVSQLTALFCSNRALDAYRNKWFNAKRGPEMDLETYGLFLLDLSRKANPASTPAEQERFAKEWFMETAGSMSMRFWLAAL